MAESKMNNEYFSGSQASIFIGDLWVDEIIDWQCSVGASSTPIYGYGDTFFRHAAQGRVLVQGSFTINFKEPNYLFAILERYKERLFFAESVEEDGRGSYRKKPLSSYEEELDIEARNPYAPSKNASKEKSYFDKRNTIDQFFTNGKIDSGASKLLKNRNLLSIDNRLVNDFAHPLFDIKIGYGTVFNSETIGEQIVGVKLVGRGKTIMANGEPLKETYSFFAKNLV